MRRSATRLSPPSLPSPLVNLVLPLLERSGIEILKGSAALITGQESILLDVEFFNGSRQSSNCSHLAGYTSIPLSLKRSHRLKGFLERGSSMPRLSCRIDFSAAISFAASAYCLFGGIDAISRATEEFEFANDGHPRGPYTETSKGQADIGDRFF